ncbi:apolipoprotein F-like [Echinops telfairi]|uniref:Apolipoprotein F-like n=1 Tax=Echinops telfairi TaxID=9371 RepID=A0ABM0IIL2_ECHTE|nr:apolipoprotein F-like [Echinops telfairi]
MPSLLLGCVLLSSVAAFPRNTQNGALPFQPSFPEPGPPPSMPSSQIPHLDARSCQALLHRVLSLAPLPEHLSNLALSVALKEIGCPTEAHLLKLQQFSTAGKDSSEALTHEIQRFNKEEGIEDAELIPQHLEGTSGQGGRARRSADLPKECAQGPGRLLHDIAVLLVDYIEKVPATELMTKLKTAAIRASQNCTYEAWVHVEEVNKELIKSEELKNIPLSIENELYFFMRAVAYLTRYFLRETQNLFRAFLG